MNLERQEHKNTCWTECIAYVIGKEAKDVPFFIGNKRWLKYTSDWLEKRGYVLFMNKYHKSILEKDKDRLYIITGVSKNSKAKSLKKAKLYHAVVFKGNKCVFKANGGVKNRQTIYKIYKKNY